MSIFASEHTRTIPIPFDPPHQAVIRRLPGAVIERAQAQHLSDFQGGRSPRGWAAVFQKHLALGIATDADATKAVADPLAGFDRLTIVRGGLKSWTYTVGDKPLEVTLERVADLDDEALEYFALEIMRLTKPALFQSAEELEAARKNG